MPRPRGRPKKYGTPAKVVAVTLPEEIVALLPSVHHDLGWAIVALVERYLRETRTRAPRKPAAAPVAELVAIGTGQSLIVVDASAVRSIAGVQLIPISKTRAFLALEPGCGLGDLERAVAGRIARLSRGSRERRAAEQFLRLVRGWRADAAMSFDVRSILLVRRRSARR